MRNCAFFRTLLDLLVACLLLMLTRVIFLVCHWPLFTHTGEFFRLAFIGGLKFDLAALMYGNVLWLLMAWFPLRSKEKSGWWTAQKWVYVVCNSLLLLANLADTVFYTYRGQRSTAAIFSEFGGDSNLMGIIGIEIVHNWYLVLAFILMVWILWRCYVRPVSRRTISLHPLWYYAGMIFGMAFWTFLFITGVRGSLPTQNNRPMSVSYAHRFAVAPADVAVVLNTPFTMIRTIGHGIPAIPDYFKSEEELRKVYLPIHQPADSALLRGRNVVILILESFSQEFSGALNPERDGGAYKGYTPSLDSIISRSFHARDMFSNSRFSIDAMPAIFASTPCMERSFVTTPYSQNHISALPALLDSMGYSTAFFHGADNESLGLQGFARHAGFHSYYGLTEYCADPSTGGMDDYDGSWGIWDEEFLQYFCRNISKMPEPFMAAVFTLSSHHPFVVPDRYKDRFPESEGFLSTLRYADMALGRFFETASGQPWFENTLFVISADHVFLGEPGKGSYNTPLGQARIPILLYDPSGTLRPGIGTPMMQQIDVMPTLLSLLGYDKPYFAFGRDILSGDQPWAFRWVDVPMLMKDYHVLLLNTEDWKPSGYYNFRVDPALSNNLVDRSESRREDMNAMLRAILQTYRTCEAADSVNVGYTHH
ncbi:MAG: LTA synthase family protein [Duncaniella sp.]|nr:LTA synthase family protein [Duncaniella sp.]